VRVKKARRSPAALKDSSKLLIIDRPASQSSSAEGQKATQSRHSPPRLRRSHAPSRCVVVPCISLGVDGVDLIDDVDGGGEVIA